MKKRSKSPPQNSTPPILWLLAICIVVGLAAVFIAIGNSNIENKVQSFFSSSAKTATNSDNYYVIAAVDGDTIEVEREGVTEKVRLIGVDTPEKNHPSRPVECFAQSASNFTKSIAEGQYVRLVVDSFSQNRDRYSRLLRYVYLENDILLNAEIIKQGYGFAYLSFPFEKSGEFKSYEDTAREESRGLWSSCDVQQDGQILKTNEASAQ